ncbi:MAG: protease inhibitor Inh/omp19 family protein [Ahrensia sp.]|nr:protease inhibitor Inh/omp19 family protein [Ahrensia sp.]
MVKLATQGASAIGRNWQRLQAPTLIFCAALIATGCTRGFGFGQSNNTTSLPTNQQAATPITPAPRQPVQNQQLQPVQPPQTEVAAVETPQAVPEVQTPGADPAAAAQPVTRQAMIGAWTVSTGGSNCQIFLALTKWSGGYRAASRGCTAPAISDVQAWDVKGKQVVLVDSSGSQAASLFRSGDTRFDGSTKTGGAISFTR